MLPILVALFGCAMGTAETALTGLQAKHAPITSEAGIFRYYDSYIKNCQGGKADAVVAAWSPHYTNWFGATAEDGTPLQSGPDLFRKQLAWKGQSSNGMSDLWITSVQTSGTSATVKGHCAGSYRNVGADGVLGEQGVSFENDFTDTWSKQKGSWVLIKTKNGDEREADDAEIAKLKQLHGKLRKKYGPGA